MTKVMNTGIKDTLVTGYWGNLVIGVWRGEPTLEAIRFHSQCYNEAAKRTPKGMYVMIIVEDGVPLPNESCRKAISSVMENIERDVVAMVGVQEATGFRGAAIRSVITSLSMLSRVPYKTTTVATVREAARWVGGLMKPPVAFNLIEDAVTELRTSIERPSEQLPVRRAPLTRQRFNPVM